MPATKIMLIRHAERPSDDGTVQGVTSTGTPDAEELTARGWQRAGALVRFFAPLKAMFVDPRLATPRAIFASAVAPHSKSARPHHTVLELATVLKLPVILDHPKGEEAALVTAASAADGPVLIAWEHEAIPDIANRILGNRTTCPQHWSGSRFDLVWVFDRQSATGGWSFAQVPQMLLSGDSAKPIPLAP
jgi:broad specificity phosphatase PhoE